MADTLYTEYFEKSTKAEIISDAGVRFIDFKKGLSPRYSRIWLDIALGYLALAVSAALVYAVDVYAPWYMLLFSIPLGALLFGYWIAYLALFFHEAAHFNIAPSRRWNDRLANACLGLLFGQDIKAYRITHFEHHRHQGTTMDTEHSYFDPLNTRFIVESLTGIKAARVLLSRHEHTTQDNRGTLGTMTILSGILNAALVITALICGLWGLAFAWSLGVFCFLPFFIAVRQVLEHRDTAARSSTDFTKVDHGAINRIFGDGPLASTLGGAGFNRHLLHHWEPQISYTRLRELEDYVMSTKLRSPLEQCRSTYIKTFVSLYRAE